jgi:hypothetical protein
MPIKVRDFTLPSAQSLRDAPNFRRHRRHCDCHQPRPQVRTSARVPSQREVRRMQPPWRSRTREGNERPAARQAARTSRQKALLQRPYQAGQRPEQRDTAALSPGVPRLGGRDSCTLMVLALMWMAPEGSESRRFPGAKIRSSSAQSSAIMVKTTSAPTAACPAVSATTAPSERKASARLLVRL